MSKNIKKISATVPEKQAEIALYKDVCFLIENTRYRIATSVNAEACVMNWHKLQHCVRSAYTFSEDEIAYAVSTRAIAIAKEHYNNNK